MLEVFDNDEDFGDQWIKHEQSLRNDCGPTSTYWYSFIEMMDILFYFRRSLKLGNWEAHLEATRMMLPYFFAYDRQNYSRFLTFYWTDMKQLPETHPQIYDQFM